MDKVLNVSYNKLIIVHSFLRKKREKNTSLHRQLQSLLDFSGLMFSSFDGVTKKCEKVDVKDASFLLRKF